MCDYDHVKLNFSSFAYKKYPQILWFDMNDTMPESFLLVSVNCVRTYEAYIFVRITDYESYMKKHFSYVSIIIGQSRRCGISNRGAKRITKTNL